MCLQDLWIVVKLTGLVERNLEDRVEGLVRTIGIIGKVPWLLYIYLLVSTQVLGWPKRAYQFLNKLTS